MRSHQCVGRALHKAGPTSPRTGRTCAAAHTTIAALAPVKRGDPAQPGYFSACRASGQNLPEVPVLSAVLVLLLPLAEGKHCNCRSKLCPLGRKYLANNLLVSSAKHHAWRSHLDLFVRDLKGNRIQTLSSIWKHNCKLSIDFVPKKKKRYTVKLKQAINEKDISNKTHMTLRIKMSDHYESRGQRCKYYVLFTWGDFANIWSPTVVNLHINTTRLYKALLHN